MAKYRIYQHKSYYYCKTFGQAIRPRGECFQNLEVEGDFGIPNSSILRLSKCVTMDADKLPKSVWSDIKVKKLPEVGKEVYPCV